MSYNIGLRKHFKSHKQLNYIQENNTDSDVNQGIQIDCSFGINPFGCSKKINRHEIIDNVDFQNYPPFPYHKMSDEIIRYWKDEIGLTRNNVTICSGSMMILDSINNLYIDVGDKVLGYSPQFPAYVNSVRLRGGRYHGSPLKPSAQYAFDPEPLLNELKEDQYKLVYIDNPNNPTGQIIPIDSIEEIVKEAAKQSICVIVDEAYGDYMDKENSAISLIDKYDNVFVVRSFSKGYALAGMRIGYLVSSEILAQNYALIDDFLLNPIGLEAAIISLRDFCFVQDTIEQTIKVKEKIINALDLFQVAETNRQTPIFLMQHPNKTVNLSELLYTKGIKSTGGFENVGKNCVRIRIPKEADQFIEILKRLESNI